MKQLLHLILLLIFANIAAWSNTSLIDAPIVDDIHFYKLPDTNIGIAFNFENRQYVLLKYGGNCKYYAVKNSEGRFEIDSDSIIHMDKEHICNPMAIAMNDGTDTPLKFEGYSEKGELLPFGYIYIQYDNESEPSMLMWNPNNKVEKCMDDKYAIPSNISVNIQGQRISIDLKENDRNICCHTIQYIKYKSSR